MAFVPTPFDSPVVAPNVATQLRTLSYLSVSDYRFAPTSVGTNGLVPNSQDPQVDSTVSLANVIERASQWIDDYCFHRADGSLVANITNEQMVASVKPDGSLVVITNFKPLRACVGLALGPVASELTSIDSVTAENIVLGEKTITLPGGFCSGYPTPWFGGWPTVNGKCIVVYSYIAGWAHTSLAAGAAAGATSITVNPSGLGGSVLYGAYAGMPLTIKDGGNTETVVLASTPSGLTLSLTTPLQFAHTPPDPPDSILVTALPDAIEQAAISLTNVLIKTQGMRAQNLPGAIGGASGPQRQALARAGALADFDVAHKFLKPYRTSYVH